MENEMIMIENYEENPVEVIEENNSTLAEKALGVAILTFAVGGFVGGVKWVASKCKKAAAKRKAKKITEAEFVDITVDQNDSEESD